MKVEDVFKSYDLSNSLLIGYYGGGNFGDELLLEVMQNMLTENKCENISILYRSPKKYKSLHHNFGYKLVDSADKFSIIRAMNSHKNVVVGGGGLWGLDMNSNTFLMSLLLFTARWVFRKKIFLLGVGYYNSTTRLGHIGAWLAGKAATVIIARDDESYKNFKRVNHQTYLDLDIAWHTVNINTHSYRAEFKKFNNKFEIKKPTLFITLRRFKPQQKNEYTKQIERYIKTNTEKNIIAAIMEPKRVDPEGYKLLKKWQKQYLNLQILDFDFNPILLYLFFQKHKKDLIFIGPQFHLILLAHLTQVSFLPMVYDNKVDQLFYCIKQNKRIYISDLTIKNFKNFISGVS